MLDVVQPKRIDRATTNAAFDRKGVEVRLEHAERTDWGIWATVGSKDAIVAAHNAHEHFFASDGDEAEERPWTTQIVDFIAEVLRGDVEIETTLRGDTPIAVRHFNLDADGERQLLVDTGFLVPARLFLWRPRRVTTERMSFL
jgi:hypothetical protein